MNKEQALALAAKAATKPCASCGAAPTALTIGQDDTSVWIKCHVCYEVSILEVTA